MSWMKRFGHLATYLPVFMAKLPTTFSPACLVLRSTLRNNARSVWVYVDPAQEDSCFFVKQTDPWRLLLSDTHNAIIWRLEDLFKFARRANGIQLWDMLRSIRAKALLRNFSYVYSYHRIRNSGGYTHKHTKEGTSVKLHLARNAYTFFMRMISGLTPTWKLVSKWPTHIALLRRRLRPACCWRRGGG